jgi:hypothetical protein
MWWSAPTASSVAWLVPASTAEFQIHADRGQAVSLE